MNNDDRKVLQGLREKWARSIALHHEGDYLRAEIGLWLVNHHSYTHAWHMLVDPSPGLGMTTGRASMIERMGHALKQVPDKQTWLASGWVGVRELVKLTKPRRLRAATVLAREGAGRKLPAAKVDRILEQHGTPPKGARLRLGNQPPRDRPDGALWDLVLDDLGRVCEQVPALTELLSPRVRLLIEARAKRATG